MNRPRAIVPIMAVVVAAALAMPAQAQFGQRGPQVVSPEVAADRQVTFRILAPNADAVTLTGSDIPNLGRGAEMKKDSNGIWEVTLGPIPSGAYRYNFNVDGVSVIDPRNPSTSESNANTWSLVYVPGSDFMDTKDVPHGAVAGVTYYSKSLKRFRRMHVYTPPGYESGQGKFPVFYLLHGASDCDDSWTSVGRAGFILDNLIAAGKAKPMVIVMPAGHAGASMFGGRGGAGQSVDDFTLDFRNEIRPHIEKNYRVYTDQKNRAIAGLSMGGMQTINLAIGALDEYAYIGVFSSGVFGITGGGRGGMGGDAGQNWEEQNKGVLDNADLKKRIKFLWFATGSEDFLIETSRATVAAFKKHGFDVTFKETGGGHTWTNWRDYLNEFAPQLFQ